MQESNSRPSASRGLTARQQHWLDHLRAAAQQNRSIAEYARAQHLDPDAMHRWRAVLKKRGVDVAGGERSAFVRASVVPAAESAPLRIVLRNGIVIEVPANAVPLASLVSALS